MQGGSSLLREGKEKLSESAGPSRSAGLTYAQNSFGGIASPPPYNLAALCRLTSINRKENVTGARRTAHLIHSSRRSTGLL